MSWTGRQTVRYWKWRNGRVYGLHRERYVVIRDRDGRVWAGPYRWQGITFTGAERFWYQYNTIESAQAAVIGHDFVGVTVKQIT